RTQSALLQAMQEREVTIAGQHRPLGTPFHVLATQNPIEQEGTYPLPEAQLDRFLVQIDVPYPDRATERDILLATTGIAEEEATQAFTAADLLAAQTTLRRMPVGDGIVEMILDLVRACRPDADAPEAVRKSVSWGPGPRAAQALMLTGLGSRLKEMTRETPKPMLQVGSRPILETIILSFTEQGFRRFWRPPTNWPAQ
ncbi:MAG: AAA family ATPase, partial [Rhodobacteraceae bacterium]|nr:AAA family ATPase [Paracoccaceae bacterium]